MNMKTFPDRLYHALEKQLYEIAINYVSECERLKQTIIACKKALTILKRYTFKLVFKDDDEEVYFFKVIKPRFYGKFIYYVCLYNYLIRKPVGCEQVLQEYITKELKGIKHFSDQNQAFNLYYRSGATHLDYIYFTRNAVDIYAELEDYQGDEVFSTSHDYRLSKLIANEQYQKFLNQQKINLEKGVCTESKTPIIWTGNQTELIELIYALAECGALNNGNIEIKTAIEFFQSAFQIDLKYYYHKFRDITNRKKERAVFLDKLKLSLDRRIEGKLEL